MVVIRPGGPGHKAHRCHPYPYGAESLKQQQCDHQHLRGRIRYHRERPHRGLQPGSWGENQSRSRQGWGGGRSARPGGGRVATVLRLHDGDLRPRHGRLARRCCHPPRGQKPGSEPSLQAQASRLLGADSLPRVCPNPERRSSHQDQANPAPSLFSSSPSLSAAAQTRAPSPSARPAPGLTRGPAPARSRAGRACPRTASSSCSWRR